MSSIQLNSQPPKFLYSISETAQVIPLLQNFVARPGVVFIGRSNVGKSCLINSLFKKGLARTSKTPGRTRAINVFEAQIKDNSEPYYIFDLPGYGHASVSKQQKIVWEQLMNTFFGLLTSNQKIIYLQDAKNPNQSADKSFNHFLSHFDVDCLLVLNKIDKLKNQSERAMLKKMQGQLFGEYKWVKQIFYLSCSTKVGIDELKLSLYGHLNKFVENFA